MATRAVFSFLGFPGWGALHLHLPHAGYPAAAALRLETASLDGEAERPGAEGGGGALLTGFLRRYGEGEPVPSPDHCLGCLYRYRIVFKASGRWPLRISMWSRSEDEPTWSEQCGPMPLEDFVNRFHPGELQQESARGAWLA
jgi:hypothetical protein